MALMLETAPQAVPLDKRHFAVEDETYQRFIDRLDAPPASNPKLRALLHSKAPWEK